MTRVPLLDRHLEDGTIRVDPGVRHGHGDGPQRALRGRHEFVDGAAVLHVHDAGEDARRAPELVGRPREGRLAEIAERDARPRPVERLRDPEADAGGGAGDEHDVVREIEHERARVYARLPAPSSSGAGRRGP